MHNRESNMRHTSKATNQERTGHIDHHVCWGWRSNNQEYENNSQ